jgi:hypothetical protein
MAHRNATYNNERRTVKLLETYGRIDVIPTTSTSATADMAVK